MHFRSSFLFAINIKEDKWYNSSSPHFFLELSFASSDTDVVSILEQEECV